MYVHAVYCPCVWRIECMFVCGNCVGAVCHALFFCPSLHAEASSYRYKDRPPLRRTRSRLVVGHPSHHQLALTLLQLYDFAAKQYGEAAPCSRSSGFEWLVAAQTLHRSTRNDLNRIKPHGIISRIEDTGRKGPRAPQLGGERIFGWIQSYVRDVLGEINLSKAPSRLSRSRWADHTRR